MRSAAGALQGDMLYKRLDAAGPAGGYIMQLSAHVDGSKAIAGDTLQPLWRDNQSTRWAQILHASTRPAGFAARSLANAAAGKRDDSGGTAATIAPSNANRIYVNQEGIILVVDITDRNLFRQEKGGATITMSPQASYTSLGNSGDPRIQGPYLDVHPTDDHRAMMGWREGLSFTTDGFSTDRALIAGVPACLSNGDDSRPAMVKVGFDPSNPNVAYAHSWGNGLYQTVNALSATPTFSKIAGFPTNVRRLRVGANGKVWATVSGGGHTIWTFDGTNIVHVTNDSGDGWHDVAINPSNPNHIFALTDGGLIQTSFNNGVSWVGTWYAAYPDPVGIYQNATDVPYIGNYPGGFDVGAVIFDPADTTKIFATHGVGVSWCVAPTEFKRVDWYSMSAGIYQLIPYTVYSPKGYPAISGGMDRGLFPFTSNLDLAPSKFGPYAQAGDPSPWLTHTWHLIGWAGDPDYVLNLTNYNPNMQYGAGGNLSGYSTNGGRTYTKFANPIYTTEFGGGCLAVSQNRDEIICFAGDKLPIYYTQDRGATPWKKMQLPGMPADPIAGQNNRYMKRVVVAADSVIPGTFLFYHPGQDSGGSAQNAANAGYFRITGGLGNAPVRLSTGYAVAQSAGSCFDCQMAAVPGIAGSFVFACDSDNQGLPLRYTANTGDTWSDIPVYNATSISFGMAAPGSNYATAYTIGVYNGVRGLHYSTDNMKTWKTFPAIPLDDWTDWTYVAADANAFGVAYIAMNGKGWVYCRLTDRKRLT